MIKIVYCIDTLGKFAAPDFESGNFVIVAIKDFLRLEVKEPNSTKIILVSNKLLWDAFVECCINNEYSDLWSYVFKEENLGAEKESFLKRRVLFCVADENIAFTPAQAAEVDPTQIISGLCRGFDDANTSVFDYYKAKEESLFTKYDKVVFYSNFFENFFDVKQG